MKKIKTLAAAAVVAVSLFSMQGDAMAAKLIRYLSEVLLSRK